MIRVSVKLDVSPSKRYSGDYDGTICMAECIRSLCVNLSVDPDTVDGVTRNVDVFHKMNGNYELFSFDPHEQLQFYAEKVTGRLYLKFKLV